MDRNSLTLLNSLYSYLKMTQNLAAWGHQIMNEILIHSIQISEWWGEIGYQSYWSKWTDFHFSNPSFPSSSALLQTLYPALSKPIVGSNGMAQLDYAICLISCIVFPLYIHTWYEMNMKWNENEHSFCQSLFDLFKIYKRWKIKLNRSPEIWPLV